MNGLHTITLSTYELAAVLKVLNVSLPETAEMVAQGKVSLCEAWVAAAFFDGHATRLTAFLGSDEWIGEGE